MARKPNYKFERMERDRAKAAKKAARAEAKKEQSDQAKLEADGFDPENPAPGAPSDAPSESVAESSEDPQ
ncbi:MAG: hypothetical protein HOL85_20900 [Rhodospirillaceae bacterium]|jgi:hypothetical protein|nr:hypothetical protein [Rhodospirillaceae bacterium]MBT6139625.1 hypothetical protein [Rhodospirillaceae bacterium]